MSLRDIEDPDEEPEIEFPRKRKKKLFSIPKGVKIGFVVLIIGIIIGAAAGHLFLEPFLDEAGTNACKQCFTARDILTKENDCYLNYINNAQMVVDGCST